MTKVYIQYNIDGQFMPIWRKLDQVIETFMEQQGMKFLGAGSGMGWRDMEFETHDTIPQDNADDQLDPIYAGFITRK